MNQPALTTPRRATCRDFADAPPHTRLHPHPWPASARHARASVSVTGRLAESCSRGRAEPGGRVRAVEPEVRDPGSEVPFDAIDRRLCTLWPV